MRHNILRIRTQSDKWNAWVDEKVAISYTVAAAVLSQRDIGLDEVSRTALVYDYL